MVIYIQRELWPLAEDVNRNVLTGREKTFGSGARQTWGSLHNLLSALDHQGKNEEAETIGRKLLPLIESGMGRDAPPSLGTRRKLITVLQRQGKTVEANELLAEGLRIVGAMSGSAQGDELRSMMELEIKVR